MKQLLLITILSLLMAEGFAQNKAMPVIDKMMEAIDGVSSFSCTVVKKERTKGKLTEGKSMAKVTYDPYRIYIYSHFPNEGAEVLWKEGWNKNQALVNPNSFPFINLSLSPYYGLLRNQSHHPIFRLGFWYVGMIIKKCVKIADDDFDKYFTHAGYEQWDGRKCHVLEINYPEFTYLDYEVKKGESVISIATKNIVCEEMIVQANKKVHGYLDVREGDVIKVPNMYARKAVFYIDAQTHLPVYQQIYDEKGIFQEYQFFDLKVNLNFTDEDFSKHNKKYGF